MLKKSSRDYNSRLSHGRIYGSETLFTSQSGDVIGGFLFAEQILVRECYGMFWKDDVPNEGCCSGGPACVAVAIASGYRGGGFVDLHRDGFAEASGAN